MSQYLLSTYNTPGGSGVPDDMAEFMQRVIALEAEMDESGAFVFGGALAGQDATTVVDMADGDVVMTDGPFTESKEHIAGFYIINADGLDAALDWAGKVVAAIGNSIEVRPFHATGKVADQMPSA